SQESGRERPKSRMSGHERRQHLIDSALRLFATHGFRGTTTKAIAQAAGVSEGIIFRHFPTKEALYRAILDHKTREQGVDRTLNRLRRSIAANDDEAVVFQVAVKTLESYRRDPDFKRLMLLAALEGHDLARVSQHTRGLPLFDLLRDYVARRQKAGAFRAGDPGLLVFGLLSLPLYFAMVSRLFALELVKQSDRDVAATFARLILDGLRPHGGEPTVVSSGSPTPPSHTTPAATKQMKAEKRRARR
ncbi:MAG: TetR/AcrR family transcriptional regulator, partial [Vicinamibacterales bacterium]